MVAPGAVRGAATPHTRKSHPMARDVAARSSAHQRLPRFRSLSGSLLAVLVLVGGLRGAPAPALEPSVGRAASTSDPRLSAPPRMGIPRGWPAPRTTGAYGSLRPMKGRTITRDGTVIENREVTGDLRIEADDVVIRNVLIETDGYFGVLVTGRRLSIERSTIIGTAPWTVAGLAAHEGGTFVANRIEVRGSEDGVILGDNSTLKNSLVHGLAGEPSSHFDSVTADGSTGWRIHHNTLLNPHGKTAVVWVGDDRYGTSAGVLSDNYLAGGGFTIYAGPGETGDGHDGIHVIDNVFSTRYYPRSGYWGVVYEWHRTGNTWQRNTWIDGPRRGRTVRP